MYIPKYFNINEEEVMFDYIEKYSFATMFSLHQGLPYVTHLPFILDKDNRALYGHLARLNGQWKDALNQQILVVFQGPHCYISPSWYGTKNAVPTWNYVAVHVYGEMEIMEDSDDLQDLLDKMVTKYEQRDSSYQLHNLDTEYLEGMSRGIVGIKINICKIEGKAKLSQNQPIERQKLIIAQLESNAAEDDRKIAELMNNFREV